MRGLNPSGARWQREARYSHKDMYFQGVKLFKVHGTVVFFGKLANISVLHWC